MVELRHRYCLYIGVWFVAANSHHVFDFSLTHMMYEL